MTLLLNVHNRVSCDAGLAMGEVIARAGSEFIRYI